MAASEIIYASGTLNLKGLMLGQGDTIRRPLNLGNAWTEVVLVIATRVVGNASLASAAVPESIASTAAANRLAIGLKNGDGTLSGQEGCTFVGFSGLGATGYNRNELNSSWFGTLYPSVANAFSVAVESGLTRVAVSNILSSANTVFSAGSEATTNFTRIMALTIKINNRGTPSQEVVMGWSTSAAKSVITQTDLETQALATPAYFTALAAPHATYDLSVLNSFWIQWPFPQNRLLVFGPTSGLVGSPFIMRLS